MSRLFYDHKDRNCDILHSTYFNNLSYAERTKLAFDSKELAKLNERDRLLMRGYAQKIVEGQKAYSYKHSRKSRSTSERRSVTKRIARRK